MKPVRVFVVEDSEPYLRGLRDYFDPGGEFLIVGAAGSLAEALRKAPALHPDVAVVDLSILADPAAEVPATSYGMRAIAELKRALPGLYVLAVSFARDANLPSQAVAAGAAGFLNKDAGFDKWLDALRRVSRGEVALTANQLSALLNASALTDREVEVLRMLADGHGTAEIAEVLHMAQSTVQTHLRAIMRKLNTNSRQEAVEKARNQGVL
jgi:two-component system, NarL family, response regulator DevR